MYHQFRKELHVIRRRRNVISRRLYVIKPTENAPPKR